MPPIREHKSDSSPSHQLQNLSPEEDIDHPSPKSDKSSSLLSADRDRNKRGKRAPSINTRASRVGVTNFINVIKSLHPGEPINYFPITRDTLQEYIDSKRKALIKAGSLEQYLQHIQAYNIALGFGWDGHEFGPIIKKALDELRAHEDETILKTGNIGNILVLNQSQQPTLVNSVISQQLQQQQQSNPYLGPGPLDPNFSIDTQMNLDPINENNTGSFDSIDEDLIPINGKYIYLKRVGHNSFPFFCKDLNSTNILSTFGKNKLEREIPIICFDATIIPVVILEQRAKILLDNLNSSDALQKLRQLYSNVSSARLPKSWGPIDTSKLHYRIGSNDDAQHFALIDVAGFNRFWSSLDTGKDVQLIVYRDNNNSGTTEMRFNASPEPLYPTSQLSSPKTSYYKSLDTPILKAVTVRSKTKVYKQKIAVSDTTTFSSLILFSIKVSPPNGKQFVIRAADGTMEYMPDDLVREVIRGVEHTEIIVSIENMAPPVDFDYF